MSDTLKLGETLSLDYKQQQALSEPFTQALHRSEDCFYAMYCNGRYLRAVLDKFGMRDMWSDYVKWAVEGAFEYIRQREYPQCVSRMRCHYFYDDLSHVRKLYEEDWGSAPAEERLAIRLYELEVDDPAPQRCDMLLFDEAYDAMWDHDDLQTVLNCARRYFAGKGTSHPVWELMSAASAIAVQDLTMLIHE